MRLWGGCCLLKSGEPRPGLAAALRAAAVLVRHHVDVLRTERLDALEVLAHLAHQGGHELRRNARHVLDAGAALADVPVEEADAEHDVRELVQLRHLVLGGQRRERFQSDAGED